MKTKQKEFRVLLTKYPIEYVVNATTKEEALTLAKDMADFSIWESEVEEVSYYERT